MLRTLSAPGKLFLSGEYAVLWGGVARVLATGGRVTGAVRRRDDRRIDLLLADGRLSGVSTPAGVHWEEAVPEAFRVIARTVDEGLRAAGAERNGFSLAIEASRTVGGHKLGFGGSARAAVIAAEATRSAVEGNFDALKVALLSHAGAQGGRGSGADVTACFTGGLVRTRRYDLGALVSASNAGRLGPALTASAPIDCARADLPRLPLVYGFTGTSASTSHLIREVEARFGEDERRAFVERSDALGDGLERALARGAFPETKETFAALQAHLSSLGVLPNPALQRMLAVADLLGCAGKQSGAGGGDGAVFVAPDDQAATLLVDAMTERGVVAFRIHPEPGLRGEGACPDELKAWLDVA